MTPLEVRRQTAQKLAQPPAGTPQKPIETCVIPAHLKGKLETIRARCAEKVAEREANENGEQP